MLLLKLDGGNVGNLEGEHCAQPQGSHAPLEIPSLRDSVVSGGLWSLAQVVVNKALALVSTFALMYLLAPMDYAVAGLALSIQSFVILLPAFTLGDALIARGEDIHRLLGTALRLCAAVSVVTACLLLLIGPFAAATFEQPSLVAACACIAIRPLLELALLGPHTRLRIRLAFRELSVIDGTCQGGATLAGITMAALNCGWASLILPQIVFTGVRAWMYSAKLGRPTGGPRWLPLEAPALFAAYSASGLGQYLHGGLLMLPPLLIGWFASTEQVGLFSMAFTLSASINVVVAVSIGLVLQPVFARMADDPNRQASAFLRSCGIIAAVSMPLCLCQAAVVGPLFRLLLPARWEHAESMAALLSIGQAFYFAVNPAMSLLKSQGRFKAFFLWQGIQLAVVGGAMAAAGALLSDTPAMAITAIASLYTLIWSPIGVWLCIRNQPKAVRRSLLLFWLPATAAALAVAPVWVGFVYLGGQGWWWDIARTTVIPTTTILLFPLLLKKLDLVTFNELRHVLSALRAQMRARR